MPSGLHFHSVENPVGIFDGAAGQDCIPKIFPRRATEVCQYVPISIQRRNDTAIFTANKFAADKKFAGLLNLQPPRRFFHEVRIAQ
jgi:hypothetical protein